MGLEAVNRTTLRKKIDLPKTEQNIMNAENNMKLLKQTSSE